MTEPLPDRLDSHLKTLRKADTQAQAITWMTVAYKLMEEAIQELKQKPVTSTIERLIFIPAEPKIEIVQVVSREVLPVVHQLKPDAFGKAWTHNDTKRLEKKPSWRDSFGASQSNATIVRKLQLIQRKGR